jgi:hypothetical protein
VATGRSETAQHSLVACFYLQHSMLNSEITFRKGFAGEEPKHPHEWNRDPIASSEQSIHLSISSSKRTWDCHLLGHLLGQLLGQLSNEMPGLYGSLGPTIFAFSSQSPSPNI